MIKQINKKTCHWQLFCTLWQIGKPEVRYHEPLASIISVARANKIIVLADGTIAEEGTPEELMNQNGLFARMSAIQTESDEWAIF